MEKFKEGVVFKGPSIKDYIIGAVLIILRLPLFIASLTIAGIVHCLLWPLPSKIARVFILIKNFVLFRIILLTFGVFFLKSNFRVCSKNNKMPTMKSGTLVFSNFVSFIDVFYLTYIASPLFIRTFYEKPKGGLDEKQNEEKLLFEPLGFWQTIKLAFSKDFICPKPLSSQNPPKLAKLCDIKRHATNFKYGPLVIFFEGKKTNHSKNVQFDTDLMKAVHEEVYKETVANLNLIRLNYEENKFQVYSESHWFLNALRIMANPYLTINVTVYNCVFSKKFPMEKERVMNIVNVFYNYEKKKE